MIQIYFLSIFFNVVAGYFLISGGDDGLENRSRLSLAPVKDETFKLILGILAIVTGLLKLLSPVEGDVPLIGDILPAAAGFASGIILMFEFYKSRSMDEVEGDASNFISVMSRNKKIVGFAVIVAAALHFLFPRALFL